MGFKHKTIEHKSIGDLLKKTRKANDLEIKDVEIKTGISTQYIKLLELNSFHELSSITHVRGALKRYAEFLSLDANKIINEWEKEYKSVLNYNVFNSREKSKFLNNSFLKTNFNIKVFIIPVVVILILFYLSISIKTVLFTPKIEMINPLTDMTTKQEILIIEGRTVHGTDIFINNQAVSHIVNGYFSEKIYLLPGLNIIEISAQKKYSGKYIIYRKVVLEQ